jgi:hypothetical protein
VTDELATFFLAANISDEMSSLALLANGVIMNDT